MTIPNGPTTIYQTAKKMQGATLPDHQNIQQVHDLSAIGVLAINTEVCIVYANEVALTHTGWQTEEVFGLPLFSFYCDPTPNKENEGRLLRMEPVTDKEFILNTGTETERWIMMSSKIYTDDSGHTLTYLFLREISALKKRERLFSYLNTAAAELTKTRDTQSALNQIAKFIVPKFANWFYIDLLKDDKLESLILKHDDPNKIEWARQYRLNYPPDPNGNTGSAVVLKTGKPAMVPVITDEMITLSVTDPVQLKAVQQIGLKSVMIVPMSNRERITGVVNFISSTIDRYFDEADLEFAVNFGNLIGLVLENTRLNEAALEEIALRKESEEKFRFLTDAIPHKMWTSGPDGSATYYNARWYEYSGIHGFESLKSQVWDLLHPDDRAKAAIDWPLAVKRGEEMEVEYRFRDHEGDHRWHLTRFSPHKNEEGKITLWVGTSTDIHEQKQARLQLEVINDDLSAANEELAAMNEELSSTNEEFAAINEELAATNVELTETQGNLRTTIEDLAGSESRFRFLLNAIPQQVWTATPDGALNYVNEVVCDDFGYTTEEIVGSGWQKFIHPDDLPVCLEKWIASLSSGKEYVVEFRLLFHDQVYRWHLARAVPLLESGSTRLWIGTNTNIDLQKTNEQKKDEFLSIASHELKTPLTNIKAFNQLLQRVKDPEKLAPFVKKSSEHVARLERLISDLLDVTKINAGKMSYTMEPFDLGKMIDDAVDSVRIIEQHREIILDNQANVTFTGDQYRLEQVVNNFISNAVKYSPKDSRVIVSAKAEADAVIVSVQDFGIGIAQENLGRLFDRYYRVDNTAMRFEGLGLGLFICSEILKRHQGTCWIESELGKGSTFYFRLPLTNS